MAPIPPPADSTVKRIYETWKVMRPPRHSRRLGASQIGKSCDRMLWYSFRWAKLPDFEGRMLRLFERGYLEETILTQELKRIGVEFNAVDPDTGKQYEFSDLGDHFVCKIDGAGCGFVEAPAAWHVVEFKTASESNYGKIVKQGVFEAKPEHYAQCQIGMGMSGMERCAYIVVNKNTDEIHMERIAFDSSAYTQLRQRAKEIIFSVWPPERISDSPAWYECKMCTFHGLCHGVDAAEQNCRTCKHSMPLEDDGWVCDKHNEVLAELECCSDGDFEYRDGMVSGPVQKAADLFQGEILPNDPARVSE